MLELRRGGAASTRHIAAEVEGLRAFLSDAAAAEQALAVPGLVLDLAWLAHMLDPVRYVEDHQDGK